MAKHAIPQNPGFFVPALMIARDNEGQGLRSSDLGVSDYLLDRFVNRGYLKRVKEKLVAGRGRKANVYYMTAKGRQYLSRNEKKVDVTTDEDVEVTDTPVEVNKAAA